ncbi:nucleotidyl transferase AbiEii/AbiGii toxin family protein [Variovorax robiniae]|uniref:Nucleotidyl transferase AbiEii/AbiGii toxin family protein n=1 Tax=Variovorax robiniae TaxID=1836199 RepID=A0ABU8XCS2_9BURK
MFERPHHARVAAVLASLDGPLLLANGCLFGGGTAMALRYGEYRESVDIDFLVSEIEGYRALRQRLTGKDGLAGITRKGASLNQLREVRADQYGIRTAVGIDGAAIKFEIILEARIALTPPGPDDMLCGVATLSPLDMATSKLLANSDRWADDAVFSRDLIDLAMMQPGAKLLKLAREKAMNAYGSSIDTDLARAILKLLAREGRLERCMQMMQMTVPPALLRQRIKRLMPKAATARP